MKMFEPIIIAHRGASGTCPENTLLAFRCALEVGAQWLELDTQLVENELVVFHDDELGRTTDGQGRLSEISLAALRRLDAGQGEKVPLLREVLLLAAGRAQVNIELKGQDTAQATAALLTQLFAQKQLMPAEVLVSSFCLAELGRFQRLMPEVRRAPVYEELPPDLAAQLKRLDCWSLNLHKSLITDRVLEVAGHQGCRVFAWTVNQEPEAARLLALGVSGFFTDYPERFIRNRLFSAGRTDD